MVGFGGMGGALKLFRTAHFAYAAYRWPRGRQEIKIYIKFYITICKIIYIYNYEITEQVLTVYKDL